MVRKRPDAQAARVMADIRAQCAKENHGTVAANWNPDGSPKRLHCAFCGHAGLLIAHECDPRNMDWLER